MPSRKEVTAWFDRQNLMRKRPRRAPQQAAMEDVIYAPTGFFHQLHGLAQERRGL